MASTFTTLGIEKMATGENAGTWGDKTNTNLDIINVAVSGYVEQAVTSGGTLALSITDGAATATAQNAVIKLTGTITGNSIVTVPDSVEKVYIVTNGTSGAYTVQFKTASGTGVTFGVSEKTTKLLYSDGTNIVDAGFSGGRELILDADGDTSITADTDDQIDFRVAGADQIKITNGAIIPSTDNDIDLGTSSLEFKDAFFDGTVTADSSLSEISTAASDDVFIAIDTSGGGLKKIARSAVVAGLATDSAISNVVEDTTPQLGGNLDMNGADIVTTSNATIDLAPNGTGTVVVRGNTNSGAIVFNCESNSHGQKVIAQPHSAGVTNVMLLPDGADSTLVSLVATQTLTNKTLTTPVIAEIDSGSTITLDATTDIIGFVTDDPTALAIALG
jgi:hypothetical protein